MTTTQLETMEVEVPPAVAVQLPVTCAPDAIAAEMPKAFATLGAFIARHGLVCEGPPRAIYTSWGATASFTLAFPIAAPPSTPDHQDKVVIGPLAGGRALRIVHHGPYNTIRETYGQIDAWLRERGAIRTEADWSRYRGMWEEYVNEPGQVPDEDLKTNIYLPLPTF